jgi:acyl dehydratase
VDGNPFEFFFPGQRFAIAGRSFSEGEIVAFAKQWDPQTFHVDPVKAKSSIFGGIVASGLHSLCLAFRLFNDAKIFGDWFEGGLAADELRFSAPVRAGDVLSLEVEVLEARESRSRPASGIVKTRFVLKNQKDETVLSLISVDLMKRKAAVG